MQILQTKQVIIANKLYINEITKIKSKTSY